MNTIIDIKKMFKIQPNRGWYILIFFFLVFNIFIIAVSMYLYIEIYNGEIFSSPQKDSVLMEIIDKTKLTQIIEDYQNKTIKFQEIKLNKKNYIDP